MDGHLSRLGTNASTCVWRPKEPRFLSTFFTEGGFLSDNRALDSQLVLRIPTVSEALGLQGATIPTQLEPQTLALLQQLSYPLSHPQSPIFNPRCQFAKLCHPLAFQVFSVTC